MRIVINQKKPPENKHKTKFFKMAARFAEEYNKHVPEEEKARIVIPYSLLLAKGNVLFPECVEAEIEQGQSHRNFLELLQKNPELFEYEFTDADKALYRDFYDKSSALLRDEGGAVKDRPASPARAARTQPYLMDASKLRHLRDQAIHINTVLELSGVDLSTWFSERNLETDFPALKPEVAGGEEVSGPGLFIALLRREEMKKHFLLPPALPPINVENNALYSGLVKQGATLIETLNEEIWERQVLSENRKIEKMRGSKEKTSVPQGELEKALAQGKRYGEYLGAIDQAWLEDQGIASKGHKLKLQDTADGVLFHALVSHAGIRKKMLHDSLIEAHAEKEMDKIVLAHDAQSEPIIYAVDDNDFYQSVTGFTKTAEVEDGDENGRVIKKREITNPIAAEGDNGHPNLEIVPSRRLYDILKDRLSQLKDDNEPGRDESINQALADMHEVIMESGSRAPNKVDNLLTEVAEEHLPDGFVAGLKEKNSAAAMNVEAVRGATETLEEIIGKNNLPKNLRSALKAAKEVGERILLPVSNGERKVSARQ